jgi:hypothetical protein
MQVRRTPRKAGLIPLLVSAGVVLLFSSPLPGDSTAPQAPPLPASGKAPAVTVVYSAEDRTTVYSISRGDCRIEWIARLTEIGVVKHWSECTAPMRLQIPLIAELCGEFLRRDEHAQQWRTLFWGRLEPDVQNGFREMSLRLALAAHRSPDWDAKNGKPRNGDLNGFVKDLANREMIYAELKEVLERFHRRIAFSCAEKVLVQKAGALPYFDQLQQQGVSATEKLPFDCMAWFSVALHP